MAERQCFIIDRIVAAHPIRIVIGVTMGGLFGRGSRVRQCIKIGFDEKLYPLVACIEMGTELKFQFEDDIYLSFVKDENRILYTLKTNLLCETYVMNETVRKALKKISFCSEELDKLVDFVNVRSKL